MEKELKKSNNHIILFLSQFTQFTHGKVHQDDYDMTNILLIRTLVKSSKIITTSSLIYTLKVIFIVHLLLKSLPEITRGRVLVNI